MHILHINPSLTHRYNSSTDEIRLLLRLQGRTTSRSFRFDWFPSIPETRTPPLPPPPPAAPSGFISGFRSRLGPVFSRLGPPSVSRAGTPESRHPPRRHPRNHPPTHTDDSSATTDRRACGCVCVHTHSRRFFGKTFNSRPFAARAPNNNNYYRARESRKRPPPPPSISGPRRRRRRRPRNNVFTTARRLF